MKRERLSWTEDAVPHAVWVVCRNKGDSVDVGVVHEAHDLACRADHGTSRWWVLGARARGTPAVAALEAIGYVDCGYLTLRRYPGGENVARTLLLPPDGLYLQYQGELVAFEDIQKADAGALAELGLKEPPAFVARVTGPQPMSGDELRVLDKRQKKQGLRSGGRPRHD